LIRQPRGRSKPVRALILSDIHSNLEALTAVLDDALGRGGFDSIWCLGDLVGYGPDPGPCLELVRRYDLLTVAGNHDYAAVGQVDIEYFNHAAKAAIQWTAGRLTVPEADFLAGLPTMAVAEPFTLVHGSLRNHLEEYLLQRESALATLGLLGTRFCLVGHSHIPFLCRENEGSPQFLQFAEGEVYPLGEERMIFNPGSVGQPRDRDPRPSYAVYDSRKATIHRYRVTYAINRTQGKMQEAGLPQYLIDRLSHGV
jgi:predicted phosphodiesterase